MKIIIFCLFSGCINEANTEPTDPQETSIVSIHNPDTCDTIHEAADDLDPLISDNMHCTSLDTSIHGVNTNNSCSAVIDCEDDSKTCDQDAQAGCVQEDKCVGTESLDALNNTHTDKMPPLIEMTCYDMIYSGDENGNEIGPISTCEAMVNTSIDQTYREAMCTTCSQKAAIRHEHKAVQCGEKVPTSVHRATQCENTFISTEHKAQQCEPDSHLTVCATVSCQTEPLHIREHHTETRSTMTEPKHRTNAESGTTKNNEKQIYCGSQGNDSLVSMLNETEQVDMGGYRADMEETPDPKYMVKKTTVNGINCMNSSSTVLPEADTGFCAPPAEISSAQEPSESNSFTAEETSKPKTITTVNQPDSSNMSDLLETVQAPGVLYAILRQREGKKEQKMLKDLYKTLLSAEGNPDAEATAKLLRPLIKSNNNANLNLHHNSTGARKILKVRRQLTPAQKKQHPAVAMKSSQSRTSEAVKPSEATICHTDVTTVKPVTSQVHQQPASDGQVSMISTIEMMPSNREHKKEITPNIENKDGPEANAQDKLLDSLPKSCNQENLHSHQNSTGARRIVKVRRWLIPAQNKQHTAVEMKSSPSHTSESVKPSEATVCHRDMTSVKTVTSPVHQQPARCGQVSMKSTTEMAPSNRELQHKEEITNLENNNNKLSSCINVDVQRTTNSDKHVTEGNLKHTSHFASAEELGLQCADFVHLEALFPYWEVHNASQRYTIPMLPHRERRPKTADPVEVKVKYNSIVKYMDCLPHATLLESIQFIDDDIKLQYRVHDTEFLIITQFDGNHYRLPLTMKMCNLRASFPPGASLEFTVVLLDKSWDRVEVRHWGCSKN